jgi:Glycosyl hydrolase catalytic core
VLVNGTRQSVVKHASGKSTFATAGGASSVTCTSSVPSGASYLCDTYQMGTAEAGWTVGAYPLDAVGQHLYINYNTTTTSSNIATYLSDVRNAYLAYEGGATTKTTQVTEVGWSTASVSARVQAQNLQTAFATFKSATYVARAYWFDVQDIPEGSLYYGLVNTSGTQKQAFGAYQKYATY